MAPFPSLTLTYFDITGRAEAIRKTLALGGVPFVDRRIAFAEFAQLKSTFPYGKIPVLEVNGEVYAETQGLLRYAARLAGLYPPPNETIAAMQVDELLSTFEDFFDRLFQASFDEKDPVKIQRMREPLLAGPLPTALQLIETRLKAIAATDFFAANSANVYVHEVLVWDYVVFLRSGLLDHIPTTLINDYETMVAIHDKVVARANAPIQHQHPETTDNSQNPVPTPSGTLQFSYFDCVGRGEHIRLALCIGGVAFNDERLSNDVFHSRKASFPNHQLPVLSRDGTVLGAQSCALLRYAGRLTGLYPSHDLLTAIKIDEVIGHVNELDTVLYRCHHEQDAEKKRVTYAEILKTTIPKSLQMLDNRIKQWKTTAGKADGVYAVCGETLTIADLAIYNMVLDLKTTILDEKDVAPYAQLMKAYDAVAQHPRVVEWYKKRSQ